MRVSRGLLACLLVGCGATSTGPRQAGAPDSGFSDAAGGDGGFSDPAGGDATSDAADEDGAVCSEGGVICRDCCGRPYCAASPCTRGYDCPSCPL